MHKLYQPFLRLTLTAAITLSSLFTASLLAQQPLQGVVRIKVSEALANRLEQNSISKTFSGELVTGVQSLDRLNRQLGVRQLTRVFPHAGKHEARHRRHGLHLWYEVRMNKSIPVSNALQSYQSDNQILRAEAVYQKTIIGTGSGDFGARVIEPEHLSVLPNAANDPLLTRQWHYNNTGQTGGTAGADIRLFDAWKIETGSPSVIIAVTDGGIQTNHPDLARNMWVNPGEIPGNKKDDDNNGYIDDVHGYSFVTDSGNIVPHDHGTHIAGTLAAVSNNATGVAGIAGGSGNGDGVKLMSCAVFTADSLPDGFAEAYVYSADNGAVISQNSWGYDMPGVYEQVVLDAIDYFIAEAGKDDAGRQTGPMYGGLAIFSAGNFNDQANYYPAFYEPVVAVASTTHRDTRAYYSNYGSWVDISAPGGETDISEAQGVVSTLPSNQYGAFMGTSMACPHVAGVAALILSKYAKPGLRPEAVKTRLLMSVDNIDAANPAYQHKLGSGRINAALALADGDGRPPRAINDLAVASVDVGEITLAWTCPGDEGDFAAEYDLRYSTSAITASNFNSATRVENIVTPRSAGDAQTFTVTNLPGGTLFFFAIRSRDFEGNTSAISNVVSRMSALAPSATVAPSSLAVKMETAQTTTRKLVLGNTGQGPLKFRIEQPTGANLFASASPAEGQVAPGSKAPIDISFKASEKAAGTYRQDLTITTNDPQHRTLKIALTLEVKDNGAPIASLSESAVDFSSVQVGTTAHRKVAVYNAGSDPLVIEKISSNNPAYRVDTPLPITVASFRRAEIRLAFTPSAAGAATGTLTLFTNDSKHRQLAVQATGEGTRDVPLVLSPDSFNETLEQGAIAVRTLSLRNNGSQDRRFRFSVENNGLAIREAPANARRKSLEPGAAQRGMDTVYRNKLQLRQERLSDLSEDQVALITPLKPAQERVARTTARTGTGREKTPAYTRDIRQYATSFEEFATAELEDQQGWFSTDGWAISDLNPSRGEKHFRGTSHASGTGEKYAISPYLFEYEEFYYPRYTSVDLRLNLDSARGTTWQLVPQDPWSYVATRIRFNADGTIDALVIDNEYETHWRRVPAEVPAGYFDLALEYNNAGSDTSGFPTYLLFINNQHVFSGTGLAPGIGQLAFVSPMETSKPILDVDELQIRGGEYIPDFIRVEPAEGIVRAGESVNFSVKFDASIMKFGTYESDIILHVDEVDSLVVPATLSIPGEPSFFTDLYALYWVLEKSEIGWQEMTLTNDGGQILDFNVKTDLPGLTVNPASGTLGIRQDEVVEVRYDGPPGIFRSKIVIETTGGIDAHVVPVNITKMDSGAVFYAPNEVMFDIPTGEISTRTFQIRNDGINTVSFFTTIPGGDSTIQVDPSIGVLADKPLDLTLTLDARRLEPGSINSAIRFTTNDPNNRLAETIINVNIISHEQSCANAGQITREQWNRVSGDRVWSIPLDRAPSSIEALTLFESPSNIGDNYGARIRGFLCVPQSGNYIFWIASNDHSELWLSTDTNPANRKRIAYVSGYTNPRQWTKFASQQSAVLYLESGKKYYIEALHKEGIGTDHLSVGWQLPNGTLERPMPGARLIPYEEVIAKCTASGTITREFWTGIQGNLISSIPLDDSSDGVETLRSFEGPVNAGINYGARIRGYICPPETGEYYFWIASNDHSELWLSADGDATNKVKIASINGATNPREWNKFRSQKSAPILLIRGKTYYIEALHKQGIGTDHVAVGWQLPDGTLERPIPGTRLSPVASSLAQQLVDDSTPDNQLLEMSVSIFPNPLKGSRLNIVVSNASAEAGQGEVFIRELTGLPVYQGKLSCESGCEAEIDIVDKFKPGIYLLLIKQGGRTITEKLVVP